MAENLTNEELQEAKNLFFAIGGWIRDHNDFYETTTKRIAVKVIQLLQEEYEFFTKIKEPQTWYEYSFSEENGEEILFTVRCR